MNNLTAYISEKLKIQPTSQNDTWDWSQESTYEDVDYYDLVDLFKGKDKYDLLNFLSEDELPQFRLENYTHTIRWVGLNHKDELCVLAYISDPKYYADYETPSIVAFQTLLSCSIEKRKNTYNHDKGHAMIVKIYHDLLNETTK